MSPEVEKQKRNIDPEKTKIVRIAIIVIVAFFVFMEFAILIAQPTSWLAVKSSKLVPYPAMIMNASYVRYSEFIDFYNAISLFQEREPENQASIVESDLGVKERALQILTRKEAVEQLARELNIKAEKAEIKALVAEAITSAGSDGEFRKQLKNNFAWSKKDFEHYVAKQSVLIQKLEEVLANDAVIQQEKRRIASDIFHRLAEGEDFSSLASELSEDPSAIQGGDIGYVTEDMLSEAEGEAIFSLEPGQLSDVVESDDAFSIFLVDEFVDSQARVKAIVINKRTLPDVLQEFIDDSFVLKLMLIRSGT